MDKFECECGNVVPAPHGKLDKPVQRKRYLLYFCEECKGEYAVNAANKEVIKDYKLKEL
ncbi:MAG: hypothetical protein ACK5LC_16560 [Coprobacillaceae bacterium]